MARRRIGVHPGVGGGRIRQYTVIGGAPMVYGVEAFDYESRLESVLRGRATGGIARPLPVGGAHPLGI